MPIRAPNGARGLIRIGLKPEDSSFETLRQECLEIYAGVLTAYSNPFPGMESNTRNPASAEGALGAGHDLARLLHRTAD